MRQGYFDFYDNYITLTDEDGDKFEVNQYYNKTRVIQYFLKSTKAKAEEVLKNLEKRFSVYTAFCQIFLCNGKKIIYNFEIGGETYFNGHKYNSVNEWDFRNFIKGEKIRSERKHRIKTITFNLTEIQLQKCQQLFYAHKIGFDITYKDYQRFYIDI